MSNNERKLSGDPVYASQVKFGKPSKGITHNFTTSAARNSQTSPGVAMLVLLMHGFDSAVSHMAAFNTQALNVHDAHITGLGHYKRTAQRLNKAVWDNGLTYSPATEMQGAWNRMLLGLAKMVESSSDLAVTQDNLLKTIDALADKHGHWKDGKKVSLPRAVVLQQLTYQMQEAALKADTNKLTFMKDASVISQYAAEGGSYGVTDENRKDAVDALAALPKKVVIAPDVQEAIDAINKALGIELPSSNAAPTTSVFGTLGKSKIKSDKTLVDFFKNHPETTVARVIQGLERKLQGTGEVGAFTRLLLAKLKTSTDLNIVVKYITASTPETLVMSKRDNARAWVAYKEGKVEIYLLGTEFENSGLTVETLVHEIVHAALVGKMHSVSATTKPMVDELTGLLGAAKEYLAAHPELSRFAEALSNEDEMVAWGMTNKDFQENLLKQISFTSANWGNRVISGMRAFIKNAVGILFGDVSGKRQEVAENGLTVLISNVAGLLDADTATTTESGVLAQATVAPQIAAYTSMEVYNALDEQKVTPGFDGQLRALLGSIVTNLHGPYGSFKEARMKGVSALDVYAEALSTGIAPFASQVTGSVLATSNQATFVMEQVEATVRSVLDNKENSTSLAYRELNRLFLEAKALIQASDLHEGDWSQATQNERETAQAAHDFIFHITSVEGRSEHLARFAAMGLAHPAVNAALKVATKQQTKKVVAGSIVERLQALFTNMLTTLNGWLNGRFAHSKPGQQADLKLTALVDTLVSIEARRKASLNRGNKVGTFLDSLETGVDSVIKTGVEKVGDVAELSLFKNSSSNKVKAVSGLVSAITRGRVDSLLDDVETIRNKAFAGMQGFVAGNLSDMRGPGKMLNRLILGTTAVEGHRKKAITITKNAVLDGFANSKQLTDDVKKALSAVLVRTGAHVLLDTYSAAELHGLVANKATRLAAIKSYENKLNMFGPLKRDFIYQAKALGYLLVTGEQKSASGMLNAANIANGLGTDRVRQLNEVHTREATEILDTLVSLYSIEYSDSVELSKVAGLLAAENARTTGENGVVTTLLIHRALENQARERLFNGSSALMVKGYTTEIYNPHTDIKVVNEVEGKLLVDAHGYVKGDRLSSDPLDPNKEAKHIYTLADGALLNYTSGAVSLTGMSAKGSSQDSSFGAKPGVTKRLAAQKVQALRKEMDNNPNFDPRTAVRNHMTPTLNASGKAVDMRYLMHTKTKDKLLQRNTNTESILGALAGSVYDKVASREQNKVVFAALYENYTANYANKVHSFREIGENSTDPLMREMWQHLPAETRKDIRDIWGKNAISIPVEMITPVFGYRAQSVTTAFDKEVSQRTRMEHALVMSAEAVMRVHGAVAHGMNPAEAEVYAKQAGVKMRRLERGWQEVVKKAKDIIVVRTGVVMTGNILSNFSLLELYGVNFADIIKHHTVGIRAFNDYQSNSTELETLQLKLASNDVLGNRKEMEQRALLLQDAISRNPAKMLVDAGLKPTIVEDLDDEGDSYSYQSSLTKWSGKYTDKLNPAIKGVAKTLVIAQDTQLYKGLSHVTQMSDFVARYTLYQHLTTRRVDPMSHEDAIFEVSEAFINYDIPMHPTMQYLDSVGITMFTKYFFRIQRVLLRIMKDKPARVLMMLTLHNLWGSLPIVLDSFAIERIGNNPFHWGAAELPMALDELATVRSAMSLVK